MCAVAEHPRAWAALVVVIAVGVSRPSAGQSVLIQADASANLGYNQTTRGATQVDPNADAADRRATSTSQVFTEVRPGISLQTGSPRLTWRATYQFSGNLSLSGDHQATYGNALNAEGVAELSPNSQLTLSAAGSQGGTSFLLSQGAADTGKPEVRAPGNPSLVSGTLVESLAWQLHRHLSLQHTLLASTSAPENALSQRNSAVTASVALNLPFSRDVFGVEAHANVSWLVPLQANQRKYKTLANALLGRWNRDFSESWNGLVTAGVEQVYTATGSRPLAILPSGSASVHYTRGEMGAGLDFTHGTATNLQVGTVSLADSVTARGSVVLDSRKARSLAFSAGFLHNEPIGDINALVAAGSGNAVQADVGLTTGITRNMLGSLRYSLAYQFAQGGSIAPTLVHILFIGVTGSYRNTDQPVRKMPKHGSRVDGADSVGFPVVEEPPTE
jgi:hypothetical protein